MQLPVITGSPTGLSTLSLIADALDRGDVDTALANTHISPDDTAVIRSLSAADRSRFATFLRAATIESGDGEYQTLRSGGRQLFMHHSSSGNWFLISW